VRSDHNIIPIWCGTHLLWPKLYSREIWPQN
jgi:hypothetical protein